MSDAGSRDAWLELSVEADAEAVEAVSEILARVAPGGVSVEPAFELVDEGLSARIDPERPAVVRAYVPARDPGAARAAADRAARDLGHLQAFGLRPIGALRSRTVHEADWAEAWKAHFPVLRIGRRLVVRPTWRRHRRRHDEVVLALDPGMAFGTGLHPTTRGCLAELERLADHEVLARRSAGTAPGRGTSVVPDAAGAAVSGDASAPAAGDGDPARVAADGPLVGASVLDVGCGSGILAIAAALLGAGRVLAVDLDPIAVEATASNARRNRLAGRLEARQGSVPTGDGPFDVVLANLIASLLVRLAEPLRDELRAGGHLIASGIFEDRGSDVRAAFEAAGLLVERRAVDGDWIVLVARRP